MRSLINGLWSILSIALALLVLGAVWYYRGGFITVAAQIDDMDIEGALVEVDGRYVGETPIRLRLTPWFHNINVMYDGVDTNDATFKSSFPYLAPPWEGATRGKGE